MSGQLPSTELEMTDAVAFDLDVVRERARQCRLTDEDLAALCSPVADWGRRLSPHTLSAAALVALARALGTPCESLLRDADTRRPPARPRVRPAAGTAEHASVLYAALLQTGPVHPDDLASALMWPVHQLRRAAQTLAVRLEQQAGPHRLVSTDTTLHLAVQPGLLTAAQERNLYEGGHSVAGLSPGEAAALTRVLHTAARGLPPAVPTGQIPRLAARGLLAPDNDGGAGPGPHPDVLFALGLSDHPLPAAGAGAPPAAPPCGGEA
ncbi:hypothetical protein ACH4C2_37020 [Streptomyces sp. NPDC018057]|uniref:hypothetical protein n=1 Tax=unclassified Streptomyces TaxID=2593676 RepID=UPI0037B9FD64